MSLLTQRQLAVLALVGSDESYAVPGIPFLFGPTQTNPDLQSYPDNVDPKDEYGFAESLRKGLSKDPGTTTSNSTQPFNAPLTGLEVNVVDFPNWERVAEINPKDQDTSGFGASIFQLKGTKEYVVALRGTDGSALNDWKANLDYSVKVWKDERDKLFSFLFAPKDGVIPAQGTVHFAGQSLGGSVRGLANEAVPGDGKRLSSGDVLYR